MPTKSRKKSWVINLSVVGLQYRWKAEGRQALYNLVQKGAITGLTLQREPDNRFDSNAIKVNCPPRLFAGRQLGYLTREAAEQLAPKLDSGSLVVKSVELVEIPHSSTLDTALVSIRFLDV